MANIIPGLSQVFFRFAEGSYLHDLLCHPTFCFCMLISYKMQHHCQFPPTNKTIIYNTHFLQIFHEIDVIQ